MIVLNCWQQIRPFYPHIMVYNRPHNLQSLQESKTYRIWKYWTKKGSKIDPCGTPNSISLHKLYLSFVFTLRFLFERSASILKNFCRKHTHGVHHPFSAGGNWTSKQIFKKGGLDKTSTFRVGLLGPFFGGAGGGGVAIFTKKNLKYLMAKKVYKQEYFSLSY